MSVNRAISIPSLIGSLSSCTASLFVLACYAILPPQRHFRHALILNLLIADFLNSLNNSVSGVAVLARNGRMLESGAACNLNGWLGQITVQTVDFSILAISIVVLVTIKRTHVADRSSVLQAALLCTAIWIPGTITSFVGLGLDYYGPVSGNWCWIKPQLLVQRYTFTHGWRIAIFFLTIIVYIAIYLSLKRTYGRFILVTSTESRGDGLLLGSGQSQLRSHIENLELQDTKSITIAKDTGVIVDRDIDPLSRREPDGGYNSRDIAAAISTDAPSGLWSEPTAKDHSAHPTSATKNIRANTDWAAPHTGANQQKSSSDAFNARQRQIRRILLLNGYPIMYIILWIPGILNRLVESVNGKTPLWLAALQSSTQFIGLANALTYGWNEGLRTQLVLAWRKRRLERHVRVSAC